MKFFHSHILAITVDLEGTHNSNICTYWSYETFSFVESGLWATAVPKIVKIPIRRHVWPQLLGYLSHLCYETFSFAQSSCVIVVWILKCKTHSMIFFTSGLWSKTFSFAEVCICFPNCKMGNTCRHSASQKSHKLKIMKLL